MARKILKTDFDVAMTPKWRQFGNFPPFLGIIYIKGKPG